LAEAAAESEMDDELQVEQEMQVHPETPHLSSSSFCCVKCGRAEISARESFCQSFAMKRFGLLLIYAALSRVCLKSVFHVCVGKHLATGWDKSLLL